MALERVGIRGGYASEASEAREARERQERRKREAREKQERGKTFDVFVNRLRFSSRLRQHLVSGREG
jgi:hypothetical protein